ncbi:MAG TPA: DUF4129 domain-containing protein [Exilispira sp.]|nr:DUF4129 domain-containing protein [Exilispira sp.]
MKHRLFNFNKNHKLLFSQKLIFIVLSLSIFFLLILLGFQLPSGVTGIKPIKITSYIVNSQISQYELKETDESWKVFYKISFLILLLFTIIYLIMNPKKIVSYIITLILLLLFFIGLPFIQSFLNLHFTQPDLGKLDNEESSEIENQQTELEVKPMEDIGDKSKTTLLLIASILLFIAGSFFLYILIRFIIGFVKEFVRDLKENHGKKRTVVKIEKAKETIKSIFLEAFHKIQTGNDLRDSILNCYSALIYAANRFANVVKSPDSTAREFEYTLVYIGLEKTYIETLTNLFEKARYSNLPLTEDDKQNALLAFQSCIKALKKTNKPQK